MRTGQTELAVVAEEVAGYSRRPFQELLAKVLTNGPKSQSIQRFADKHPDRWGQLLAIAARTAGFTEKTEIVNVSILGIIKNASDSELLARLDEIEARLRKQGDPVEEAKIISTHEDAVS